VNVARAPCGTLFEAARLKGIKTGTVCTSRVTHATPASFGAHAIDRNMEPFIAQYLAGTLGSLTPVNDLLMGGGLCEFLPKLPGLPSCRSDSEDLLLTFKKRGYNIITNREQLVAADNSTMPLVGLFSLDHMAYDIDRALYNEPSLAEMTEKALDLLTSYSFDSPYGFILMVEGSRIGKYSKLSNYDLICFLDMAAHTNDPQAHYRDIVAYQRAIQIAKKYTKTHEKTLLISISDHETGGLALGYQRDSEKNPDYVWFPEPIINATRSIEFLANQTYVEAVANAKEVQAGGTAIDMASFIRSEILQRGLGMTEFNEDLVREICAASRNRTIIEKLLSISVSQASQVGWSTHGHSGVDVNLYAYGYKSEQLMGNHDNTFIGSFIEDLLGLNLDAVTERIKEDPVTNLPWVNEFYNQNPPFRIRHYHVQNSMFD
jgi:alkaline phosphatase